MSEKRPQSQLATSQPVRRPPSAVSSHLFALSIINAGTACASRGKRRPRSLHPVFDPVNSDNPACNYDPPPFLRARPIRIKEKPHEKPIPVTIGPGTYTPTARQDLPHSRTRKGSLATSQEGGTAPRTGEVLVTQAVLRGPKEQTRQHGSENLHLLGEHLNAQ
jgi:hypothetical protein